MAAARPSGRADALGWWAGTLLGIGRARWAPGTVASVAAVIVAAAVPAADYGAAIALLAASACAVAPAAARRVALLTGDEDPKCFVLDEAAGMWLAVLHTSRPSPLIFVIALAVFRVLDIWKPWPIRRLEGIGRGWGVLLDDVAAGVLTLLVTLGFAALMR